MLDDFDARPGSITSLLRTFVGLHMRRIGGWIAVADLVDLLGTAGLSHTSLRGAISRVKSKGLLVSERRAGVHGYTVGAGVAKALERGDEKIFSHRRHTAADGWCLLSFTVPESRRPQRDHLRRLLAQLGCGSVADGLWIAPHRLAGEVEEHLAGIGLREAVTVFDSARLRTPESLADPAALACACAQWWDLGAIAQMHLDFIAGHAEVEASGRLSPADAFVARLRLVDDWRPIPYRDPGLPAEAVPAPWPGEKSALLFFTLMDALSEKADLHVAEAVTRRDEPSDGTPCAPAVRA